MEESRVAGTTIRRDRNAQVDATSVQRSDGEESYRRIGLGRAGC
jgi:hypothetical protein